MEEKRIHGELKAIDRLAAITVLFLVVVVIVTYLVLIMGGK